MDHAHPSPTPSPYGNENSQHRSYRPRPFYSQPGTPTPLGSTLNRDEPLSLQRRRLQLRNAGFRAPQLAGRRISAQFSKWKANAEEQDLEYSKENSPQESQRRRVYGENLPPNPVSILQEITNSTRRKVHSPRPSIVTVFDNSSDLPNTKSPHTSWYHDPTPQSSPFDSDSLHNTDSTMKPPMIHEDDENTPPPTSSPLAKPMKGRKKRSLNLRKTSFEASQYIEHLESQLAAAQNQVDSLTSPAGPRRNAEKSRTLVAEIKTLKLELADWEKRFEVRLKETVQSHTENEYNLKNQIKTLEQEVHARECIIRDLESQNSRTSWDQKALDALEEKNRSLEATNRSLEKRIDILTELLAQSPTKSQHGFELSSPVRDGLRRARPKSMMPRIPSSPGGPNLYRTQSAAQSPATPMSASMMSSPLVGYGDYGFSPIQTSPHNMEQKMPTEDGRSLDSGLGESCSARSLAISGSQRSSMMSQSSASPAAWGLPLPMPLEEKAAIPSRSRKMRRFPSGSNSLKPLLLPAASGSMSISGSAPLPPTYATANREVSGESLDPTISFLSRPNCQTPTQTRQRSSTWAADDALKALEGGSTHFDSFDEILAKHEAMMSDPGQYEVPTQLLEQKFEEPFSPSQLEGVIFEEDIATFLDPQYHTMEPQSLTAAVEPSLTNGDSVNPHEALPSLETFDVPSLPPLEPDFDLAVGEITEWGFEPDPKPLPLRLSPNPRKRRKSNTPSDRDDTPKPAKVQSPKDFRLRSKSVSFAALASSSSKISTFRRYTNYFRDFRRDPTALARRVIANAWQTNWGRLGSLSWWVLGLFLGSGCTDRDKDRSRDESASGGDDFDWHYYSAEASKARRFEMHNGPGPAFEEPERAQSTGCQHGGRPKPRLRPKPSKVTFDEEASNDAKSSRRCRNCDPDQHTWAERVKLWAKFSFALVLAVGGAFKDGPEAMLADCQDSHDVCEDQQDDDFTECFTSGAATSSEETATLDVSQVLYDAGANQGSGCLNGRFNFGEGIAMDEFHTNGVLAQTP